MSAGYDAALGCLEVHLHHLLFFLFFPFLHADSSRLTLSSSLPVSIPLKATKRLDRRIWGLGALVTLVLAPAISFPFF